MTTKWYDVTDQMHDVYIMNRLRLARNMEGHVFPGKLLPDQRQAVLKELEEKLMSLCRGDGDAFSYYRLDQMEDVEREALYERRAINYSRMKETTAAGLVLSADESVSLVLNGEDHIRLQYISANQSLEAMWPQLGSMDDRIGERIPYAYDKKYGYLTSYLTNVGTGLRASVILHLPLLSTGGQFRKLIQEFGRFGVSIKSMTGEGNEAFGGLYEVKNQKTLGLTETELIRSVSQAAAQLAAHERKVRSMALHKHRLQLEDEIYKSYGVLQYARKLTYKEAISYLSQLRLGICTGMVQAAEPVNLYRLMLHVRPANLKLEQGRQLEGDDLAEARASYVRAHLPRLV